MRVHDKELAHRPVLQEVFRDVCGRHAQKEAIVVVEPGGVRRFTYGQLLEDATCMAGHLQRQGLKLGEHVAVWMPNGYEWLVTRFAVALAGLILVPLNTRLRRDDLAQILLSSDARVLVTAESFANIDYLQILRLVGVLGEHAPNVRPAVAPQLDMVVSMAGNRPSACDRSMNCCSLRPAGQR